MNWELPDVQAGFRKGRGTRNQIANIHWIIENTREFQKGKKKIYFCFIAASLMAQKLKCLPGMWEIPVWSLGREDPWRRKCELTPVFLPEESHGGRSLVGYNKCGQKESDTTDWLHFHFSALLTMLKPLTVWITSSEKFFKRWEYQTLYLSSGKSVCKPRSNS